MNQGLYELRTVSDMPSVAGAMVCATEDHLEHTERLMQGFIGSIGEQPIDAEQISERARRTVAERRAYLWQLPDRRIVSLSAIVRETPNTASISWVYTAPAARRNGYAAQLVAALSQANWIVASRRLHGPRRPTSNAIYRGIGYRLITLTTGPADSQGASLPPRNRALNVRSLDITSWGTFVGDERE